MGESETNGYKELLIVDSSDEQMFRSSSDDDEQIPIDYEGRANQLRKERDDARCHNRKLEKQIETLSSKLLNQRLRFGMLEREINGLKSEVKEGTDEVNEETDAGDNLNDLEPIKTDADLGGHDNVDSVSPPPKEGDNKSELIQQIQQMQTVLDKNIEEQRKALQCNDKQQGSQYMVTEKRMIAMATLRQSLVGYLEWEASETLWAQSHLGEDDNVTGALVNLVEDLQKGQDKKNIKYHGKPMQQKPNLLKFFVFIVAPILLSALCFFAFVPAGKR